MPFFLRTEMNLKFCFFAVFILINVFLLQPIYT